MTNSLSIPFKYKTISNGLIVIIALSHNTSVNNSSELVFVFVLSSGYRIGNLINTSHDLDNEWTQLKFHTFKISKQTKLQRELLRYSTMPKSFSIYSQKFNLKLKLKANNFV